MAAGEYVSVRSQSDSETAALTLERAELEADDSGERREVTAIYVGRGVDPVLAKKVAEQLMVHDAMGAHAPTVLPRHDQPRDKGARPWAVQHSSDH